MLGSAGEGAEVLGGWLVALPLAAQRGYSHREGIDRLGVGGLPLGDSAGPDFCLLRRMTGADKPYDHEGAPRPCTARSNWLLLTLIPAWRRACSPCEPVVTPRPVTPRHASTLWDGPSVSWSLRRWGPHHRG